ncbi:transposase [Candidatus Kuenenia stuttgartiensis]|uniref:transposase n=1 Tax=Kuenenia stuttgartiensis TaxID=174633 RepID=UPI003B967F6D
MWTSTELNEYLDFPYVKQVFCIHRIFTKVKTGKKTEEIVYGITSLTQQKASPKTILKFSRGHWSIENGLHYVRDTSFREDHSQIRTQNAPRAMASLKNLVVGLFHFLNVPNIAKTLRNFAARPFLALQMLRL